MLRGYQGRSPCLVIAAATIIVLLTSPALTQRGNPTPAQGDESAKLATTYDPTKATVITAADISAAIASVVSLK
jgi:hypothetical protein